MGLNYRLFIILFVGSVCVCVGGGGGGVTKRSQALQRPCWHNHSNKTWSQKPTFIDHSWFLQCSHAIGKASHTPHPNKDPEKQAKIVRNMDCWLSNYDDKIFSSWWAEVSGFTSFYKGKENPYSSGTWALGYMSSALATELGSLEILGRSTCVHAMYLYSINI